MCLSDFRFDHADCHFDHADCFDFSFYLKCFLVKFYSKVCEKLLNIDII